MNQCFFHLLSDPQVERTSTPMLKFLRRTQIVATYSLHAVSTVPSDHATANHPGSPFTRQLILSIEERQ